MAAIANDRWTTKDPFQFSVSTIENTNWDLEKPSFQLQMFGGGGKTHSEG